jgi:hypothetical protein
MQQEISVFTSLAHQYGPFLFAILFTLVVTRVANNFYSECRKDPRAGTADIALYRMYFASSFVFSIVLVLAAVSWWFWTQKDTYVFRFAIDGLRHGESVESDDYFRRRWKSDNDDPKYEFVVVQDKPFAPGKTFSVNYFRRSNSPPSADGLISPEPPLRLKVPYNGEPEAKYAVNENGEVTVVSVPSQNAPSLATIPGNSK